MAALGVDRHTLRWPPAFGKLTNATYCGDLEFYFEDESEIVVNASLRSIIRQASLDVDGFVSLLR